MKILFVGPGFSGKDTAASMLADYSSSKYDPLTATTSRAIHAEVMRLWQSGSYLLPHGVVDVPIDEFIWKTRIHNRQKWIDIGNSLRKKDPIALVRWCLDSGNDLVTGVRTISELVNCRELFDLIVWIERGFPRNDIEFGPELCDVVINNFGTLEDLKYSIQKLFFGEKEYRSEYYYFSSKHKFRTKEMVWDFRLTRTGVIEKRSKIDDCWKVVVNPRFSIFNRVARELANFVFNKGEKI